MEFITKPLQNVRVAYANRHEPECARMLANMYWKLLLVLAALIGVAAISYGLWQTVSVVDGVAEEVSPIAGRAASSLLDTAKLEIILENFSERGEQYTVLQNNPVQIADPSR